jgi:hypothetical protein
MTAQASTTTAPKRENLLINIVCNIALPSFILSSGSKAAWLGPKLALIVALLFPLGYSIHDYLQRRKFNFLSAIGFLSILITGGFALLQLDVLWFAVKEAAVPAVTETMLVAAVASAASVSLSSAVSVGDKFVCSKRHPRSQLQQCLMAVLLALCSVVVVGHAELLVPSASICCAVGHVTPDHAAPGPAVFMCSHSAGATAPLLEQPR